MAKDLVHNKKTIAKKGDLITRDLFEEIDASGVTRVDVRSVLACETQDGVCQCCYGMDLARNELVEMGLPIGIVAAQSIGEPGTQLTMRTFHSGGVAKEGGDITTGLARVEEIFEARIPKYRATISQIEGKVSEIAQEAKSTTIKIKADEKQVHEYYIPDDFEASVKTGDLIKAKQMIARSTTGRQRVSSDKDGIIEKIENRVIYISDTERKTYEYVVPHGRKLHVAKNDIVKKGQKLCDGDIDVHELMQIADPLAAQLYIVSSIQEIYASQGQTVNSRHICTIVRQMFSKIRLIEVGDTIFFPGDIVDFGKFHKENDRVAKKGKKEAIGERLILGIAKVSLHADSWLSAASFQETVRVLVEASTAGSIDHL